MKKLLLITLFLISCGPQGIPGAQGPAGADLNPITIVQFCPGSTNYPTTFQEVGFCINNQIWAVYSLNNGFLTLIPPGAYNSNALGSNCNFVVNPNCVISY
jgi:hypothetical protein